MAMALRGDLKQQKKERVVIGYVGGSFTKTGIESCARGPRWGCDPLTNEEMWQLKVLDVLISLCPRMYGGAANKSLFG